MAIKGLKDLHYAPILKESAEETVYGDVKPLGPAMAFNMQPSVNRGNLRADDKVLFSDTSKGPITVTLNVAYLDKEVQAAILGKEIHENGMISDNAIDQAPYIAIGGRAENARGGYDYFWVYRVKLAPADENAETKQETPTYQSPNLSGEALPRLHDGEEKTRNWDRDDDINPQIFNNWFKEVIDKDYAPTA
ncbi:major tail protein [Alkalicoccobacillus gibsonii]|uniref:major tail protein n=1 Tax=Alkalicoccobacillus gibsonii TaxID=79881 RepID=UPI003F7C3450